MKKRRSGLVLHAVWTLVLLVVPPVAEANPVMPGVTLRVLPNGLRLLIREQHSAPLVAVDAWVRAGSGREREGESGAAHFLEHLLFKGTPSRKPGEIDAAIEDLGATLSAFTLRDAAHFCTTVPSNQAKTAVDVLADALRNSVLNPAEVERERAVILDEIARGRNDAQKTVVNLLFGELDRGGPYARPVLGDAASIRSIARESISAFYKRWYTPANTTLVMVGDVTVDRAVEMAQAAFESWSGSPPPEMALDSHSDDEAPRPVSTMSPTIPDGNQLVATAFRIAGKSPATDRAAGLVLAALLGDARTGTIAMSLAKSSPPAEPSRKRASEPSAADVVISGEYTPSSGPSLFILSALGPTTKIEAARQAIDSEIEKLGKTPLSLDTLEAARRGVIGAYLYDIETYSGQASALGQYDVLGDYTAAQTLVDRILAMKPTDVSAFAQAHLTANHQADLILNPLARP